MGYVSESVGYVILTDDTLVDPATSPTQNCFSIPDGPRLGLAVNATLTQVDDEGCVLPTKNWVGAFEYGTQGHFEDIYNFTHVTKFFYEVQMYYSWSVWQDWDQKPSEINKTYTIGPSKSVTPWSDYKYGNTVVTLANLTIDGAKIRTRHHYWKSAFADALMERKLEVGRQLWGRTSRLRCGIVFKFMATSGVSHLQCVFLPSPGCCSG
jgi:hypothetical protein